MLLWAFLLRFFMGLYFFVTNSCELDVRLTGSLGLLFEGMKRKYGLFEFGNIDNTPLAFSKYSDLHRSGTNAFDRFSVRGFLSELDKVKLKPGIPAGFSWEVSKVVLA